MRNGARPLLLRPRHHAGRAGQGRGGARVRHDLRAGAHPHPGTPRRAHPTGGDDLPDDRYIRTLDPWISLATAAAVTSRIRLSTAVALPVESDPITLAKQIATLDHLSGGRVTIGAGFGWNTDELEDHHVPAGKRRTVLREYVEAMRALWTAGGGVVRRRVRVVRPVVGLPEAGPGAHPADHRRRRRPEDLRLDRPHRRRLDDHPGGAGHLRQGRRAAQGLGRRRPDGSPDIHVLIAASPPPRTSRAGPPPAPPS